MSGEVLERKAYFIGQWKGDVVSDNIIHQLRTKSQADRGKKVKVKLSKYGLQIRKSTMFQGSILFDSYRMEDIYFMTVNQQTKSCLLCIVRDVEQKYSIMAFRCASEYDAGLLVQTFNGLKGHTKQGSYEMTRKGDGNWTLRNRSGPSTRQYLPASQTRPMNGAPNGSVKHIQQSPTTHQTLLPDEHVSITKEDMFLKGRQQHNIGIQTTKHDIDVDQMSEVSDVSAFKDELESLSQELREIKYLLEKSTGISADEYLKKAREEGSIINNNNNNNNVEKAPVDSQFRDGTARVYVSQRPPPVLVSDPPRQSVTSTDDVFTHDLRSSGSQTVPERPPRTPNIKTSDVASVLKREFSNSHMDDSPRVMAMPLPSEIKSKTLPHGSVSRGSTNGVPEGYVSGGSSVRVKFDPKSMHVTKEQKTRSMRMSSDFMVPVPSTVEKPIEQTYSRGTIRSSGHVYNSQRPTYVRRNRPQSVYIMTGAQPMKVHNPRPAFEAQF